MAQGRGERKGTKRKWTKTATELFNNEKEEKEEEEEEKEEEEEIKQAAQSPSQKEK